MHGNARRGNPCGCPNPVWLPVRVFSWRGLVSGEQGKSWLASTVYPFICAYTHKYSEYFYYICSYILKYY